MDNEKSFICVPIIVPDTSVDSIIDALDKGVDWEEGMPRVVHRSLLTDTRQAVRFLEVAQEENDRVGVHLYSDLLRSIAARALHRTQMDKWAHRDTVTVKIRGAGGKSWRVLWRRDAARLPGTTLWRFTHGPTEEGDLTIVVE